MRNYVLHDFSAQKVLEAIEQNFIGFNCACVRVGQGDVYEESELTWIFTGTPLRFFNHNHGCPPRCSSDGIPNGYSAGGVDGRIGLPTPWIRCLLYLRWLLLDTSNKELLTAVLVRSTQNHCASKHS